MSTVKIKPDLEDLLEQPLTYMWRAAGFQFFEFGEQRPTLNVKGKHSTRGQYVLDVACAWRILKDNYIVIGGIGGKQAKEEERGEYEGKGIRFREEKVFFKQFEKMTLRVKSVLLGKAGILFIDLGNKYTLELLPISGPVGDEHWRLFSHDLPNQLLCSGPYGKLS